MQTRYRGNAAKHKRESDCRLADVRLTGLPIRLNSDEYQRIDWSRRELALHCCRRRYTSPCTAGRFDYSRFSVIEQRLSIKGGRPVERMRSAFSHVAVRAIYRAMQRDMCTLLLEFRLDRPRSGDREDRWRTNNYHVTKDRIEDTFDRSEHVERRNRNIVLSILYGVLASDI